MPKKQIAQEPEREEDPYFVAIKNPLELRRQILESSKKTLYCLQNYQRMLIIRQEKAKQMATLRESIRELGYLNKKFNQKLPAYYELLEKKVEEEETKDTKESKEKPVPVVAPVSKKPLKKPVREKTELEKLEESLSTIEGKLKTLGTNQE
jgi:hypothetical protein